MGKLIFGYRHVSGIPLCPCKDPGNYMMAEKTHDPLVFTLTCWCGRSGELRFDDIKERREWIAEQTRNDGQNPVP